MKTGKVVPVLVVVASALIVIANTPAILTDPLVTAVAQIRQNAAKTESSYVNSFSGETPLPEETLVPKKANKR